ncbi:MAG: ATP-binding protein [Trueperaceae bacterium]|nr:ATP-binding protein [Trueperaceae bacterium]
MDVQADPQRFATRVEEARAPTNSPDTTDAALSRARYQALFGTLSDGLVRYDTRGCLLEVSAPPDCLLLHGLDGALGKCFDTVLPGELAEKVREGLERVFSSDEVHHIEDVRRIDGRLRRRSIRLARVSDHEGLAVVRDHDEHRHAEAERDGLVTALAEKNAAAEAQIAELQALKAEVERASRHKSEFLTTMSHELRTPLTAILGFSELLKDEYVGALNDQQRVYTHDIHTAGEHMLSLVNDILDLAKIEGGKFEVETAPIDPVKLVRDVVAIMSEKTRKQGVELAAARTIFLNIDVNVLVNSETMLGDARKIWQILLHFLDNAFKFTPDSGEITLGVTSVGKEIYFTVTDTGIGITPEDQQRIFEPFFQVDGSLTRTFEGLGLGLALAKKLAELHGGRVWCESELGKGSCFGFAMPLHTER